MTVQGDDESERWVLAFDASCARCQRVSTVVAETCARRLEVLPLADSNVQQWREQALGAEPPWIPTLLRIRGDRVRAWTNTAMIMPLVRRLGPSSTVRLLRALGELRHDAPTPGAGINRKEFLRVGAGVGIAAGLVLGGGTALADSGPTLTGAKRWVRANAHALPQRYAEIVQHPVVYRKAIFAALPPQTRGAMWVDHLKHYQHNHTGLSESQRAVIDEAKAIAAPGLTIDRRFDHPQLRALGERAVEVFGNAEATALLGMLGPADESAAKKDCNCCPTCSVGCGGCEFADCDRQDSGCGELWIFPCEGYC